MKSVILLNVTDRYLHLGCALTILGLRKLLAEAGMQIIYELDYGLKAPEAVREFMLRDENCLLIINGEGTFHSDQSYMGYLLDFCRPFRSRTMLLNSQLYNVSGQWLDLIRGLRLVQLRTKADVVEAEKHNISSIYCPDMLFYSGVQSIANVASLGAIFTDSQSKAETRRIWDHYKHFSNKKRWVNFHYDDLGARSKFTLALRNFCNSQDYLRLHYRLYNRVNRYYYSELLSIFSSCNRVVTGRYHAACLAILFGKELHAFGSNTPKVNNLLRDFVGDENVLRDTNPFMTIQAKDTELRLEKLQIHYKCLLETLRETGINI